MVVFGRLKHVAIDEAVLTDGRPDIHKLEPLARLGGPFAWSAIGEILEDPPGSRTRTGPGTTNG